MVDELTAATGFAMEVKRRKPLKICNSARSRALGIVAESLRELKKIASSKFGLVAAKCRVCLDSDGTEIENEEYFSFLEDQTKLLILGDGERWTDGLQSKYRFFLHIYFLWHIQLICDVNQLCNVNVFNNMVTFVLFGFVFCMVRSS